MENSIKVSLFLFCAIFVGFFGLIKPVFASSTPAPTIVEAGLERKSATKNYLFIKGLTSSNTEILVYIDGEFIDMAKISSQETGTDSFYFRSQKTFLSGEHEIMALARNKVSVVLSVPVVSRIVVPSLPAPTLVAPSSNLAIGTPKPIISGLTVSETIVHIYIDGVYNGAIDVLENESGTANFAYEPFLNLTKGTHKVWAVAEDELGRKSRTSNTLVFEIEDPMPAPTMLDPLINTQKYYNQPIVVGLAKNDSLIKIYIDKKLAIKFLVDNHESGTANFSYQADILSDGDHLVYATASDLRGKESKWSNLISLQISRPIHSSSTAEVMTETGKGGVLPESESEVLGEKITKLDETEVENEINDPPKEDQELITEPASVYAEEPNNKENKNNLISKIRPELLIFILFVLGVIAWVVWVNRELVKEKQSSNKAEDVKTEAKDEKNN